MLPRVIPILGINNKKLVKTVNFKNPKYLGDPLNAIKIFNSKMVDEIAIVDIRASKESRKPDFNLIEKMAGECFSPLSYGGGIKNLEDASTIFSLGIEKIILNSMAYESPEIIRKISNKFGSQSVVVSLDVGKSFLLGTGLYAKSGTFRVKGKIQNWVSRFVDCGVGEFILNDISRDGTFCGYNYELINMVSTLINVPLTALGGAGSYEDMRVALNNGAQAVSASSLFVYRNNNINSILIDYPKYESVKEEFGSYKYRN